MLALMCYAEARRPARRDAAGAYVPLEEQDTRCWNGSQIAVAEGLLREANRSGPTGRYQLEAAIQSAHTARRMTGRSNWSVVVQLYDHLLALTESPVVVLNRAVALAEIDGPEAALAAIEPLGADKRLLAYQPYWAARGHLLAKTGAHADAAEAWRIAIGLTTDEAVRAYLRSQLAIAQAAVSSAT
jgi:RNA polymerase sigma-70 factor (ECF subfamily)